MRKAGSLSSIMDKFWRGSSGGGEAKKTIARPSVVEIVDLDDGEEEAENGRPDIGRGESPATKVVAQDVVAKERRRKPAMAPLMTPVHYGTKPGHFETSKIHCPTSEGVSEVSERANE